MRVPSLTIVLLGAGALPVALCAPPGSGVRPAAVRRPDARARVGPTPAPRIPKGGGGQEEDVGRALRARSPRPAPRSGNDLYDVGASYTGPWDQVNRPDGVDNNEEVQEQVLSASRMRPPGATPAPAPINSTSAAPAPPPPTLSTVPPYEPSASRVSLLPAAPAQQTARWSEVPGRVARPPHYQLRRDWNVDEPPRLREFWLDVTTRPGAPDGYGRTVISVNGHLPGPLIEVNEGDEVRIHVRNRLAAPTSIHWHGLDQNGTASQDGISGFTQCPIPARNAGGVYTYQYRLNQYGTYWFHSHFGDQYSDGLEGAYVIHSPRDPYRRGRDYDDEVLVQIQDWYHTEAESISTQLNTATGYNGSVAAPPPQSLLVNGFGRVDCALVSAPGRPTTPPLWCRNQQWPILRVVPGRRYRLRIVNGGSHAQAHVSLDEHKLSVIATDGKPVAARDIEILPIHNGQRYDVLFTADQGRHGDLFWLRIVDQLACYPYTDGAASGQVLVAVQYDRSAVDEAPVIVNGTGHALTPHSRPWNDTLTPCIDLPDTDIVPISGEATPQLTDESAVHAFDSQLGIVRLQDASNRTAFFLNNITHTLHPYLPYLQVVADGGAPNSSWTSHITWGDHRPTGDIIVNNIDPRIPHPFHLHGRHFHLVGRGMGLLTPRNWSSVAPSFDLAHAPQRDTLVVPGGAWAVLRVILDDPGVWAFHCHIAFHLAQGKLAAVVVHPNAIRQRQLFTAKSRALCNAAIASGIDPYNTVVVP